MYDKGVGEGKGGGKGKGVLTRGSTVNAVTARPRPTHMQQPMI